MYKRQHLGRPKGVADKFSLKHIIKHLSELLGVEGVETSVLRDDGHVGFVGKIPHGSLHADDVLRSVGFPRGTVTDIGGFL